VCKGDRRGDDVNSGRDPANCVQGASVGVVLHELVPIGDGEGPGDGV